MFCSQLIKIRTIPMQFLFSGKYNIFHLIYMNTLSKTTSEYNDVINTLYKNTREV